MTEKRRDGGKQSRGRHVIVCRWFAILLFAVAGAFQSGASVDLVVNGTDAPDPVITLSNLTYTITVTNTGTAIATNVVITNALSSRATFVSVTNTRGSCSNVSGVVYCDWGRVTNGTGGRVTIVARPIAPGFITNTVSAGSIEADTNPANNIAAQVTAVVNRRTLGSGDFIQVQDVTANAATPYPSTINVSGMTAGVYKVTVTLTNLSHSGPDDLDIMLVGPSGAYIMLYSDGAPAPSVTDATLTFDDAAAQYIPDVSAITSGTFKPANYGNIPDTMPSPAPAGPHLAGFTELSVFNRTDPNGAWRLFVYDDEPEAGGWIDGWGLNILTMEAMANLGVTVTDSADPVLPGQTFIYIATITNAGPAGATAVQLTNRVPAGLELVSYSITRGTCTNAGGIISCDVGTMSAASSEQLTVQVRASNGGIYTNQAEVASNQLDTQPSNNVGFQVTTVNPRVDLGIDLSASRTPALLEQPLIYVLSVTNLGPDAASGIRITNELPPGVVLVNAAPSQGSCTNQSGIVSCNLGVVASRGRASVLFTCRPTMLGPITNVASVIADQVDANLVNNFAVNTNTVDAAADLQLTINDSPDPVLVSQVVTYTIALTNRGPNTASNIVVSDIVPAALAVVSVQSSQGACTNSRNAVGCAIPELLVGDRAVITIAATALTAGTALNAASVAGQPVDPNPLNSSATASTVISPTADVSLTKIGEPAIVWQGDRLTYTLLVSNNGPNTATLVRLSDTLPPGMTSLSISSTVGSCVSQVGTVSCSFGDLGSGASARVVIQGTIGTAGLVTNTANAFANESDLNSANNIASAVTEVVRAALSLGDTNDILFPDVGTAPIYPLTLNVSGMTAAVERVRVTLQGFSHTYPDDLDILLVGPGGQRVVLMSDAGGGVGVTNMDLIIDDLAPAALPDEGPLSGFHYRPANYGEGNTNEFPAPAPAPPYAGSFDIFRGTDPNGAWKLYVVDDQVKDRGALHAGWRLDIWAQKPLADALATAVAASELLAVGSNLMVTVTVSNIGPGLAQGVVLTNACGTNLALSGAASSQGGCSNDVGTLRCELGEIAPGGSALVQMSFTALTAGTFSNSVGVTSSSVDFNRSNNLSTVSFTVENPPVITSQPRDQRVPLGATAIFEVAVTGDAPLVYQWFHNGNAIQGGTSTSLTINDVQENKFGQYYVQISNRVAAVLSTFVSLGLPRPPVIDVIADQLTPEDTLLSIPLGLSDPDNPLEVFILSGVCDDTNLVPTTNITFRAEGTNYSLSILPGTNRFGTNVITITAIDSTGLATTRSFVLGVEAINDYPFFVTPVGDLTVLEDSSTYLSFQIGDVETADTNLIYGVRSYNQTLFPDRLVAYGGGDRNRYIILNPAKDSFGTALMELRIRDETGVRTTNLFTVTVLPVEDPPTISPMEDVTIAEDSPLTVRLTVNDVETPAGDLLLRAESANTNLFSNDSFVFGGIGENRILNAIPVTNQTGITLITVFVEDAAGMISSNTVLVNVTPVNDAPLVSEIPEIVTAKDQTSAEILFTIGDLESDATNLTLTAISTNTVLAPLSGIEFGGSGSNRTMRVSPGAGEVGWMVLQVSVADPSGAVTIRHVELFVHQTNGAPLIIWQPEHQDLAVGEPLRLRVIAKGPGKLKYQWQRDGQELSDQTNAVFAVSTVAGTHRGDYRVRVSNDDGTVLSDVARVTVLESTEILSLRRIGESVELTFGTVPSQRYFVEYQDALDTPWTAMPELSGTGGIVTVTDPVTPNTTRFYRVRVEQKP